MKTKKILAYALVCTIFLSLFPLECIATFQTFQPLESQFNITIQDETAQPVNNANIYIYSYLDQSVVASATTDFDGTCKVTYMIMIVLLKLGMSPVLLRSKKIE